MVHEKDCPFSLAVFSTAILFSCGQATSEKTYQGATVGALGGAVAGALIDKNNRWRGAVIGGVLGAAIGGTITEIASRAARRSGGCQQARRIQVRGRKGKSLCGACGVKGSVQSCEDLLLSKRKACKGRREGGMPLRGHHPFSKTFTLGVYNSKVSPSFPVYYP